ncbi:uncharacterized protein LOC142228068 [Haematobia irritans]|uniref:uncharacterized protein LOC142228068 n=1 Tax=Haematobia irritans TaxID=7368 RepID=UPI003F4FDDF3
MLSVKVFVAIFVIIGQTISDDSHIKGIHWNNVKPGKLLQALDTLTSVHQPHSVTTRESLSTKNVLKSPNITMTVLKHRVPKSGIKTKIHLQRRADDKTSSQEYDYDKTYDTFVRQYFEDSAISAATASTEDTHGTSIYDSAEEQDVSVEGDDPLIEESKHTTKTTEGCRDVIKNRNKCRICNRNGSTSESCSYNKESVPKSFVYEVKNKYRQHRELNPETNEKSNSLMKRDTTRYINGSYPLCVQKTMRNKVCYHCESEKGDKTIQCFSDLESKGDVTNTPDIGNKKNVEQTQQRIYKRTVMYTFEKVPPTVT